MDIQASERGHIQDLFRNDLTERRYNDHIRIQFSQPSDKRLFPYFRRLKDRNAMLQGLLFHRSRHKGLPPALRLIRLRHHSLHPVSGLCQSPQRRHREIRCSHVYNLHHVTPHPRHRSFCEVLPPQVPYTFFRPDDRSRDRRRGQEVPFPRISLHSYFHPGLLL